MRVVAILVAAVLFPAQAWAGDSALLKEFQSADYRDVKKLRGLLNKFANDIGATPKNASSEELLMAADMASCLWNVSDSAEEQKTVAQLGYKWAQELYARTPNDTAAIYFMSLNLLLYSQSKGVLDTLFSLQKVKQYAERAHATDPRFLYSSPGIALGALYLFAPGFPVAFGDVDKAEAYLIEAAKNEPRNTTALAILGAVYAKKGETQKALEAFEAVRKVPGWNKPTTAYDKDMDFWWHIDQIRALRAIRMLKKGEAPKNVFEMVDKSTRDIQGSYLPQALEAERAR